MKSIAQRSPETHRRFSRGIATTLLVFVGLLLLVQIGGSTLVTSWANRKLAAMPGYHGHVDSVRIELWRASIVAHDLTLIDRTHETDGPILTVGFASITLAPSALLRGKIGGRGSISDVGIAVVQDSPAEKKEAEAAKRSKAPGPPAVHTWQAALQNSFPVEVTRFEITNLKLTVATRGAAVAPQTLFEDFHLLATDFRTHATSAGDLPAKLSVRSHFSGGGTLSVDATADTGAIQPHFKATMEIKDLNLVPLRDLLLAAVNVDVSRGTFELFVEVNAEGGRYDGYLKPFFRDLEFKAVSDPNKNIVQRAVTTVASAVTDLLKNKEGKVATKAPFKGNFEDTKLDVWTTIENLLRNAFVQSLREGFEGAKPTS